jgi:hypothetical protein
MADKKVEKALYGPSMVEVALGAVLGLLAGVVLACVYLVFKPVEEVKEVPQEPARGTVYHLTGRTDAAKARAWQAKLTAFTAGGTVIANEEELNAWARSLEGAAAPAPAAGAKAAAPGAPPPAPAGGFISASDLNFRLDGQRVHVAQRVLLNYYGISKEVVMQAAGGFTRSGDTWVFRADQVYLGSCPLHAIPGAAGALARALVAKQKVPDDFRAAWSKISEIGVEGGLLKVTTQP